MFVYQPCVPASLVQQYEGSTGVFPVIKTTLADTAVAIDESSAEADANSPEVTGLAITPSHFGGTVPTVVLNGGEAAGVGGTVTCTVTLANPLPADGVLVVGLPHTFTAVTSDSATLEVVQYSGSETASDVIIGSMASVTVADGAAYYTVTTIRSGDGTSISAGTVLSVTINGVQNQQYEGPSGNFPVVRTQLSASDARGSGAVIDEWLSSDSSMPAVIAGMTFTTAEFADVPVALQLTSVIAGAASTATVDMQLSNPLPVGGHIYVEFPSSFDAVAPDAVTFTVTAAGTSVASTQAAAVTWSSAASGSVTVDIVRDASHTDVIAAGSSISVSFSGLVNQRYEGSSGTASVWTTLPDGVTKADMSQTNEVSYVQSLLMWRSCCVRMKCRRSSMRRTCACVYEFMAVSTVRDEHHYRA